MRLKLMICEACYPAGFEIKTVSAFAECCVCRSRKPLTGPVTVAQRDGLLSMIKAAFERGRVVGFAEGMKVR